MVGRVDQNNYEDYRADDPEAPENDAGRRKFTSTYAPVGSVDRALGRDAERDRRNPKADERGDELGDGYAQVVVG